MNRKLLWLILGPRDAFQVGKDEFVWASRSSLTSCGLMLPKLLCKYTYSLSKIGRIGDRNCPRWNILCVQHLLMKEIVLVISPIPSVGIWVASWVSGQVFRGLFALWRVLRSAFAGQRSLPRDRFSHRAFHIFCLEPGSNTKKSLRGTFASSLFFL